MTRETEETEDTETRVSKDIGGGRGGPTKLPPSSTALSTIAVQAGRSQVVISVLKSGSLVHLQLVQVQPGLCEIGSDQEENQMLIQEQRELLDKLMKHEGEVLSAVEKKRQMRRRKDGEMMERMRSRKQEEEEEEVSRAMGESLREGWSLLVQLLQRRQEVLTLASDFYHRALEFSISIQQVENLQINDAEKVTEVKLVYDSMRRDVLGKSLQVLNSSSVLLQKLKQLQWTEALQRRGGVLQEKEDQEVEEESPQSPQSPQSSRGTALKLEELVEMLQDRRRRADQGVRLQLQRVEGDFMVHKNQSDDWSLTTEKILDQNQWSGSDLQPESGHESRDLQSESRPEETEELMSRSGLDLKPGSRSNKNKSEQSRFRPWGTTDLPSKSRSEETEQLQSGSGLDLNFKSKFRLKSELDPKSGLEQTGDLNLGSKDLPPGSRSDLLSGIRSEETTKNPKPESRSDLKQNSTAEENIDLQPESRSVSEVLQSGSGLDMKTGSRSNKTRNQHSGFSPLGTMDLPPESRSDLPPESIKISRDLQPGSRFQSGSKLDMQPGSGLDQIKSNQVYLYGTFHTY